MVMCEPHMNISENDDSGCLVHSFSDSSRVILNCCRHSDEGFELLESDGEVSQFDSLDNSEGGMSAENFNTLKKGPLVAPIDPPPEFQDSPQTTLLRRSHTSAKGYHEFAQLLIKDILGEAFLSLLQQNPVSHSPVTRRTRIISASDPQLNVSRGFSYPTQQLITSTPSENIYDEPSDSTRNSDDIEVDYYISKQLSASLARKKSSTLSANSQRLSSLQLRPNSGHSLHSRLSSSHNSLAMTVTSKVDDTTFITQAMSHDPLMSRQSILDFYNVPLDSDIYALPVDVLLDEAEDEQQQQQQKGRRSSHGRRGKLPTTTTTTNGVVSSSQYMSKSSEAKRRLFRKAQTTAAANNGPAKLSTKNGAAVSSHCQLAVKRLSAPDGLTIGATFNYPGGGGVGASGALKQHSNNHKKRGKREKRSSSNSNTHSVAQQLQTVHGASDSSDIETGGTTATDAATIITVQGNAEEGHASSKGAKKEVKRRGQKEGRTAASSSSSSSSKPLTITISKTVTNPSSKTSGVPSSNKEREREKKATIPISTSFTSQSSMQSNCGAGAGGGTAAASAIETGNNHSHHHQGKTTKREARDATKRGHSQFSTNLKQKFCSIFRFRNNKSSAQLAEYEYNYGIASAVSGAAGASSGGQKNGNAPPGNATATAKQSCSAATIMLRALPPLPKRAPPEVPNVTNGAASSESNRRRPPAELPPLSPESSAAGVETDSNNNDVLSEAEVVGGGPGDHPAEEPATTGRVDFASNLETIKQYGWYWGPISCQAAEKILSNEPDGSFIVRDSSDDHYIFSLTFKLNNCVRHVRIEQDKGTFSFGTLAKFKARTIVEFIEQALEYSRSGRYLFFLHRRPEHGPMRVQLKNPVSRFKHIQSLQHMCRFVIMKAIVRKDLISSLPLPNRLKDYLSYKNCYTEHFEDGCGEVDDGPVEGGAMTGNEGRTEGEQDEQERN